MARNPVITSPCPVRWSSMPQAGRDHCGHCDRRVHNLDGMGEAQRKAFLAGCSGKVCVAYTINASRQRRNAALGAGLLAALAVPGMAMANEESLPHLSLPDDGAVVDVSSLYGEQQQAQGEPEELEDIVLMGGIDAPSEVRWADDAEVEANAPAEPEVITESEWLPSKHG